MSMLIKKWFNMLASDKTPGENLKSLLRPYEIMIDKRLYETFDNLVIKFIEVCYEDPTTIKDPNAKTPEEEYPYTEKNSPFSLDAKKLQSQAKAMLNMSIIESVGEVWSQFGVNIESAKSGPAVRKIKLCRAVVKERLMKRFNTIISEFETTINNLQLLKEGKFKVEETDAETVKTPDNEQEEITVSQEEGTQQ